VPDGVHFVPAHPVAGTEHSGPDAGKADLFDKRWTIITPADNTQILPNWTRLCKFWQALGATIEVMTAQNIMIWCWRSPAICLILIAYNIVGTADDLESVTQSEVIKFSAGGFRDFTRIAASDPTMWRDIFPCTTKRPFWKCWGAFQKTCPCCSEPSAGMMGTRLMDLFTRTRAIRRSVIESGQDTDAPSFGRD
jgi:cyclohexadieny/prephenate dehydrogenase